MKKASGFLRERRALLFWAIAGIASLGALLLFRLGTLTDGLSGNEFKAIGMAVGFGEIYRDALYLPLKATRAVVFTLSPDHGQLISRVPNVIFGALAIGAFVWLIKLWHGLRIAVLAGFLFATSAWVLHASRLASFDVLYLWAVPTILLVHLLLQKRPSLLLWWLSGVITGALLYVPGLIWLVIINTILQRKLLGGAWRQYRNFWQRSVYVFCIIIWLPLLAINLVRDGRYATWIGLPETWPELITLAKQFVAVPVYLFIRGPQYPELWLGRAPILDIFTLVASLVGIYFYFTHRQAVRSRLLAAFFVVGWLLVALKGPVGLSLLIPILYMAAATGIAYLLHDWRRVFPLNPLARGFGLALISIAVALSCLYNLRSYFVAWPNNQTTKAVFQYRL